MWPFSTSKKLWKVGKHRVKKVQREKVISSGRGAHGEYSNTKEVTRYKCIDCERVLSKREKFLNGDYTCYDVIKE